MSTTRATYWGKGYVRRQIFLAALYWCLEGVAMKRYIIIHVIFSHLSSKNRFFKKLRFRIIEIAYAYMYVQGRESA